MKVLVCKSVKLLMKDSVDVDGNKMRGWTKYLKSKVPQTTNTFTDNYTILLQNTSTTDLVKIQTTSGLFGAPKLQTTDTVFKIIPKHYPHNYFLLFHDLVILIVVYSSS